MSRFPDLPPSGDRQSFLRSYEWQTVRMRAIKRYGTRCQCCGATAGDGVRIVVDHIRPRLRFPELALDIENLQVLCADCNQGKSNWDETDWRDTPAPEVAHLFSIIDPERGPWLAEISGELDQVNRELARLAGTPNPGADTLARMRQLSERRARLMAARTTIRAAA